MTKKPLMSAEELDRWRAYARERPRAEFASIIGSLIALAEEHAARADEAEAFCSRFANDSDAYREGERVGHAKAVEELERLAGDCCASGAVVTSQSILDAVYLLKTLCP